LAPLSASGGYRFGAVVMDAVRFVPQSRPRLFIVAVREDLTIPESSDTKGTEFDPLWHPAHLVNAYERLPQPAEERAGFGGVFRRLRRGCATFGDIVDDEPKGVDWHTPAETRRLLSLMSPINLRKS
jgi:DNA (cytosine-5)-methyltransferase 1